AADERASSPGVALEVFQDRPLAVDVRGKSFAPDVVETDIPSAHLLLVHGTQKRQLEFLEKQVFQFRQRNFRFRHVNAGLVAGSAFPARRRDGIAGDDVPHPAAALSLSDELLLVAAEHEMKLVQAADRNLDRKSTRLN